MEVIVVRNENSVIERLWSIIEKVSTTAITERSVFRIGLSGGSLIKYLAIGADKCKTDWSKWELYFCDERFVDETDDDSTFGQYKKLFIPHTPLNESQFVIINRSLSLDDCAKDYERQILEKFGNDKSTDIPRFDLLLLGMGPDGHTCSLFPGHPLLHEQSKLIAPIFDSPKPPPERVTMTYPLINSARVCLFAISGQGKAEMIKRILKEQKEYPARLVKPTSGQIIWLIDHDAASLYF